MQVRLVTMQRDERLLLEPWLRYHGYLFGYENLVVLDNGSTDAGVIATLSRFERVGVVVIRAYGTARDFDGKGELIGEVIRDWDRSAGYDYAIPLDCDEFVGLWQDGRIGCSRAAIHAYLDSVRGFQGCYGVETNLFNIPGEPGWYWPQDGTKVFFRARTFKAVDHGFHFGKTRLGDQVLNSQLTYFHFHHKPYAQFVEGARNKLRPYVDVDRPGALAGYEGPGGHLLAALQGGEAAYVSRFAEGLRLHLPELGDLFGALGIQGAMFEQDERSRAAPSHAIAESRAAAQGGGLPVFDGPRYRRQWLDVATEGFDPLLHYVRIGRGEGRGLG